MTAVVTGASGHLGANLVRALLARGRRVRCLLRRDTRAVEGLAVERAAGDVRDPASLERAFAGASTVFHLAAVVSISGGRGGLVEETNVAGARNVARAARACGVRRLVHCSSVHAFDQEDRGRPIDEGSPRPGPGHPAYDRSKAAGEAAVLEEAGAGLAVVVVNPTGVIGPFDFKPSRMGRVLLALERRRLPGLVEGGFFWVDARDVAQALVAAESRGRGGEGYLVGAEWRSVRGVAELAAAVTGVPPPRLVWPQPLARLAAPLVEAAALLGAEPLYTRESLRALRANPRVDVSKARRELGFAPRPLAETVRDTYAWFAAAGALRAGRPLRRPEAGPLL